MLEENKTYTAKIRLFDLESGEESTLSGVFLVIRSIAEGSYMLEKLRGNRMIGFARTGTLYPIAAEDVVYATEVEAKGA